MKKMLTSVLFIILLVVPYSNAGNVLENSSHVFIGVESYADSVPLKAYSILALTSLAGKVQNTSEVLKAAEKLTLSLLSLQNPDGGWGHYANEISTPHDTALAILALHSSMKTFEKLGGNLDTWRIKRAIRKGRSFLMNSYREPGWGYAPETNPEFYPTALALWALGDLGVNYSNSNIARTATEFLEKFSDLSPEYEALRLIAFHAVGYPNVSQYLLRGKVLLSEGNLNELQRAILTYAVLLYDPFSFEVAKSLAILEIEGMKNDTYILATRGMPFMSPSNLITTSYAVMAFAKIVDLNQNPPHVVSSRSSLYNELISIQNPDGGWPLFPGGASSAKATYYALLGIFSSKVSSSDKFINRAVSWAENHIESAKERAKLRGTVTEDFYYTVKILSEFGNLSKGQRLELINFTRSLETAPGLWRGLFNIPQPYETALGLDTLITLGYSGDEINNSVKWLLSVSDAGWGLRLNDFLPATTAKDIPTTITVLEVLSKLVPPNELYPHVRWIIQQRLPSGVWGYYGKSVNLLGEESYSNPSMEYTIRVVAVLRSLGYDYSDKILPWILKHVSDKNLNTVEKGLALWFITCLNVIPAVTLHEVINKLAITEGWMLNYWPDYLSTAREIRNAVKNVVALNLIEDNLSPSEGNHLLVAPPREVNVSLYNPTISLKVNGSYVVLNGKRYPLSTTVFLIPGRTQNGGYVLIILADKAAIKGVPIIFRSGLYHYLHGTYIVLSVADRDKDGIIELSEIELLSMG